MLYLEKYGNRGDSVSILITVLIVSLLFSMKNLLGTLIRLAVYVMIILTIFTDQIVGWDNKLFAIGLLSIPIVITFGIKTIKAKVLRV